uniref:WD_REPEATS_REGION domain-containing protein n=1 Tax=Strongyloides venezuelensis TaxID=75913 RepID=A0A0K0F513_STRVS
MSTTEYECEDIDIKEEVIEKRNSSRRRSSYVKYFTCRGCNERLDREDKDNHEASCELFNISKRKKSGIYRSGKSKQQDEENGYMYESSVKMRMEALGIDKGVTKAIYHMYVKEVRSGKEKFIKQNMSNGLIDDIEKKVTSKYKWEIAKEQTYIDDLHEEQSIRFVFDPEDKENLTKDDKRLLSLEVTKSVSHKQAGDNIGVSYLQVGNVGNAVSCIRTSMFTLNNDEDLIGISTFQNPDTLTASGTSWQEESLSGIQFWTCNPNKKNSLTYKFSLQTMRGCVLDFCFSNIKPKNELVLVYFAVAFSHGLIGIYALPKKCKDFKNSVYEANAIILLNHPSTKIYNETITTMIPYTKISWSPYKKGSLLSAVSANDFVHVWDFNKSLDNPYLSIQEEDQGHVTDVAFCNENIVSIAYYDRYNTFFDLNTNEVIYAESRPRTSGRRLTIEPHIFQSVGIYQTLLTNANDRNTYLCHVLSFDNTEKQCYSAPIYGRHQVQLNDMAFCPNTGTVITTGSDGKVIFNLQCVIVPNYVQHSRQFAISNSRLCLIRKSFNVDNIKNEEVSGEESKTKVNLTRTQCAENLYLEVHTSQKVNSNNTKLDSSTMDLKIEALFRLAASQVDKNCSVYTAGEGGLLFCVTSNYKNIF